MKQCFYNQVWQPLKNLVKRIGGRREDDDDHFNHPYLIL
jgi:hypothetical protein